MRKRIFLIITDLDSTFEEYTKKDFPTSDDQFKEFIEFVEDFEKTFDCEVKIHFVSGVGKSEIKVRLKKFKNKYPNSIYKRIDESVIEDGIVVDKNGNLIDRCDVDYGIYSKADGVFYICQQYGATVLGACYMGDAKEDIPGFKMMKEMRFPLGSYALCTRSQRDCWELETYADFVSQKPRIHGCCECLDKMRSKIIKKIEAKRQRD